MEENKKDNNNLSKIEFEVTTLESLLSVIDEEYAKQYIDFALSNSIENSDKETDYEEWSEAINNFDNDYGDMLREIFK